MDATNDREQETSQGARTESGGAAPPEPSGARLVVDGANVMGSRPDGWWRDRPAARRRLVAELAGLEGDTVAALVNGSAGPDTDADAGPRARGSAEASVLVVFDGWAHDIGRAAPPEVRFAPDADDAIATLAGPGDVVATSDRELVRRVLARGAQTIGARRLLDRLGSPPAA